MAITGITPSNVGRLRVYEEVTGSAGFAVDHTGTLGDFVDVPIIEGTLEAGPDRQMIDTGQLVQSLYDYRLEIFGKKMWKLSFSMALAPTGTAAASTVSAVQGALGKLLKIVWGGESLSLGSTAAALWGSASSGQVTVDTTMLAGSAIGWVDSDGVLHAREVEENAASVTTKVAFPSAPAMTDVIYGSATYYLKRRPDTTAQFIVEGLNDEDRWLLLGGQGTVTFDLPLDGESMPTANFEFVGRAWEYGDDAAVDLTASELAVASYTNHSPISGHAGRLIEQVVGTASPISTTCITAIEFGVELTKVELTCPSGPEGISGFINGRTNGPTVKGKFTTFFEDLSDFTTRDARTSMYLAYQIGVEPGKVILITAPTVQYGPVMTANEEARSTVVEWKGRNDADTVIATHTDLSRSPARVAFL
jgi:hypothetical protein